MRGTGRTVPEGSEVLARSTDRRNRNERRLRSRMDVPDEVRCPMNGKGFVWSDKRRRHRQRKVMYLLGIRRVSELR